MILNFFKQKISHSHQLIWALLAVIVSSVLIVLPPDVVFIGILVLILALLSVRSPLTAIIILLILAPLRTLIATESAFLLPLDIGQLLFVWLLCSYSLWRIRKRQEFFTFFHLNPVFAVILIFLVATGFTGFVAWDMGNWINEWLKWWVVAFVMLISAIVGRDSGWQWLVFAVVISACANAIVGIYIFFGGSGADHLLINDRFFRAFGTFGQPNPFGGFMGIVTPLAIASMFGWLKQTWHMYQHHDAWQKSMGIAIFYSFASGLIVLALLFSWSRGAWLSIVLAISALMFALPRRWFARFMLIVTIVFMIGGVWFAGILPESIVSRVRSSTEELFVVNDVRGVDITSDNYAVVERLAHWQAAFSMAENHPWLGVGFGNYEVAYEAYRLINWDEPLGHAHNYYLNILAEAGIIGTLAYLLMWIGIVIVTWQTRNHPDYQVRFAMCGLFGSWVYILAHSFLDNVYVNNLFIHLGVLFAIVIIQYRQLTEFLNRGQYDAN